MPRVTPLYYHYSNEPSICDAFNDTHVQYINDTLHVIRSVFKTPIYTLYQICKICVSSAVQYICIVINGKTCSAPLNILSSVSTNPGNRYFTCYYDK